MMSIRSRDTEHVRRGREILIAHIRDKKGPAEPLFHDAGFLRTIAYRCLWESAKTSKAARGLKKYVDSVKSFGSECLKHLPDTPAP